jgi:twitching motility protein PilT
MARIDAFLKLGLAQGCSDVHLAVGVPPMLRMNGDLMPIKFRHLSDTELEAYVREILTAQQIERLEAGHDIDFSYVGEESGRYRVNIFRKVTGVGAVFRHIPGDVPTLEQLHLPKILTNFCDYHQGMVLVTGSTGTGKSTTLAAMINYLNETRSLNIISLEDPIEFVHPSKRCQVIQRELHTHVRSFADGVRSAMREDPDVILVGELRDAETIMMAMTAAETGHLVFGTLHTTGAVKTIDRIIDALPGELREQTKAFLGMSLKAVVTQVLCKTVDGRGRRAILEILVNNRAIAKMITSDQSHQIASQLQTGANVGMQLMDAALLEAIQKKEIDPNDAIRHATDKSKFQRFVTDTDLVPLVDVGGNEKLGAS